MIIPACSGARVWRGKLASLMYEVRPHHRVTLAVPDRGIFDANGGRSTFLIGICAKSGIEFKVELKNGEFIFLFSFFGLNISLRHESASLRKRRVDWILEQLRKIESSALEVPNENQPV